MLLKASDRHDSFRDELLRLAGWSDLSRSRYGPQIDRLQTIFGSIDDERFPGAVLPRLHGRRMTYYAGADTARDWNRLRGLLVAAIGVTVTDFDGRITALDPSDAFESEIAEQRIPYLARISAHGVRSPRDLETATVNSLVALRGSIDAADVVDRTLPRSTPQALHEFRMALNGGDRQAADELIGFLHANLRLDALNQCYLRVQLHERFEEWGAMRAQPFFVGLCQTRRPQRVTAAMVEALYHTAAEPVLSKKGPAAALELFCSELMLKYGNLFAVRPPSPRPGVACAFLLAALCQGPIDSQVMSELATSAQSWPGEQKEVFLQIMKLAQPSAVQVSPRHDHQAELELAADVTRPVTVEGARAVLLSAAESQTLQAYEVTVSYVRRLSQTQLEELVKPPVLRAIWSEISRHMVEGEVPRDWREWAEMLPRLAFDQARACAEKAATEWPIAHHIRTREDVQGLVAALSRAHTAAPRQLDEALPDIVAWAEADEEWPRAQYLPLYELLVDFLLLSERRSPNSLSALSVLLDGILSVGLSSQRYERLLRDVGDFLQTSIGLRSIDWCIDLAEMTITQPCPSPSTRAQLWGSVNAALQPFVARMAAGQVELLDAIGRLLGTSDAHEDLVARKELLEREQPAHSGDGVLVAVYTLKESVGQRAKEALAQVYPGLKVELFHDVVSTRSLRTVARKADLFVVCWSSAKHAATNAIREARGQRASVYATGGSTAILRAVGSYLSGKPA